MEKEKPSKKKAFVEEAKMAGEIPRICEKKKNDILLIISLSFLSLAAIIGVRWIQKKSTIQPVAVVMIEKEEYKKYPLNKNITEKIQLSTGEYNILEIRNGKADIIEASCPDQICVHHRSIELNQENIVCLPHQLVVEIQNGKEQIIDSGTK